MASGAQLSATQRPRAAGLRERGLESPPGAVGGARLRQRRQTRVIGQIDRRPPRALGQRDCARTAASLGGRRVGGAELRNAGAPLRERRLLRARSPSAFRAEPSFLLRCFCL